jgi:hypothetical protein
MSRWKAFAIHLGISVAIGATVFALLFFLWYPGPMFTLTGGQKLTLLLIGVDVAIGPLLTLAVFKSGKPGLKFDLCVIALLQATALSYGLAVSLIGRPAFTVFDGRQFIVVHANAIDPDRRSDKPEYQPGFGGPRLVALKLPTGYEAPQLIEESMAGHPLERMSKYYVPYDERIVEAAQAATDIAELHPRDAWVQRKIDALRKSVAADERLGFVTLSDAADEGVVIVSRNDGRVYAMLDTPPK